MRTFDELLDDLEYRARFEKDEVESAKSTLRRMHQRKADEAADAIEDLISLCAKSNALLHQIDIGDFTDSHGHSAKMLKATHDLKRKLEGI